MSSKLILKFHVSLDGFIATPNNDVDWIFQNIDAELQAWEVERLWQADVHLMGRNVYEEMASYWPGSDEPYAPPMNQIPKAVYSRRLTDVPWGETRVLSGEFADEIYRLKEETNGVVFAHGGAMFAQTLIQLGLVDEYRLLVHPVALGSGNPCFGSTIKLRLNSSREFPSGVVALTYSPLSERE